uniref:Secreted protein n=1 Tax=Trichogramma kaykai TaxID=54128 RepID=A0ABD2WW54_9HYME
MLMLRRIAAVAAALANDARLVMRFKIGHGEPGDDNDDDDDDDYDYDYDAKQHIHIHIHILYLHAYIDTACLQRVRSIFIAGILNRKQKKKQKVRGASSEQRCCRKSQHGGSLSLLAAFS